MDLIGVAGRGAFIVGLLAASTCLMPLICVGFFAFVKSLSKEPVREGWRRASMPVYVPLILIGIICVFPEQFGPLLFTPVPCLIGIAFTVVALVSFFSGCEVDVAKRSDRS